jgi:hypothetical protein
MKTMSTPYLYDSGRLHIGKSIDVEFLVKGLDTWFSVWYLDFEDISTAELAIWRLARKEVGCTRELLHG